MGQVHAKTELGAWITFISSLKDVHTIVDVGTWSGSGTTLCAAKGVRKKLSRDRNGTQIMGFEIDQSMVVKARRRLRGFRFVSVVYGSLVDSGELDRSYLSPEEEGWFKADLEKMALAPVVLDQAPDKIDLLILDGGEFSSQAEYFALRDRTSGWMVLDDITTRKNKKVFDLLASDDLFSLVWVTRERNGAAIFLRSRSVTSFE